jgi:hypothetical protein
VRLGVRGLHDLSVWYNHPSELGRTARIDQRLWGNENGLGYDVYRHLKKRTVSTMVNKFLGMHVGKQYAQLLRTAVEEWVNRCRPDNGNEDGTS